MSSFQCNILQIDDVQNHPNADRLTLNRVKGYTCISAKLDDGSWRYQKGDFVIYIPEAAVLPEWLLKRMDFWKDGKGTLNGSRGDRVKAIKLRNVVSQGILFPVKKTDNGLFIDANGETISVSPNEDVSEKLGINKYEPPIPSNMSGEVWNAYGHTLKYDVENIQRYPDVFEEGEPVTVTEKLHGTFCCYGISDGTKIVTSKGLSARGLAFKLNEKNFASNLYLQTLKRTEDENEYDILDRLESYIDGGDESIYILGEVYGRGVQDLNYGEMTPKFRMFDVYVGKPDQGRFMSVTEKQKFAQQLGIDMVPILYTGPFSMEKMTELRDGKDYSNSNIREGIVIYPQEERHDIMLGRVQLKFVSPDYLLRKGGTELQ